MYNSFIHEQRATHAKELEQIRVREAKWQKRYHTEVQPCLLQHYDKRINSFIHNVGEKPIIMNPERLTKMVVNEKRRSWVFRNGEDWRSFYNTRQRQEIKNHQKYVSLKIIKETNEAMHSPSPLPSNQRTEYRSRSKEMEIHPPMRYKTNKMQQNGGTAELIKKKTNIKEFMKILRTKDRERNKIEAERVKQNLSNFISTHHSSLTSKHHDEDDGDFMKNDKTQNIQIQARIYEKQREVVQKKLHFKKLMDLSIKNPNQSNRKEYKTILERCGLLRGKRGHLRSETTQLDKFTSMVQTADRQRQNSK